MRSRYAIGDLGIPGIGEALRLRLTGVEQLGDDLLISARPAPAPDLTSENHTKHEK